MWCVYAISPIDFGWALADTVETFKPRWIQWRIDEHNVQGWKEPDDVPSRIELEAQWVNLIEEIKTVAKKGGWEGDFRSDMHVVAVPGDTEFGYAFVWKQDNNGTTFIVSQGKWPAFDEWLEYEGK